MRRAIRCSSLVQLELVNDGRGAGAGDLEPDSPCRHRVEADFLMKYVHRPVIERRFLRGAVPPGGHSGNLLPFAAGLDVDLEPMDVRKLPRIPAFEQDRPADAPFGAEVELEPGRLRLAIGLPIGAQVS